SLRHTAASLAYAAPEVPMDAERSARLRARLLARAAADRPDALSGAAPASVDTGTPSDPVSADAATPGVISI
ncbi:hypothetical protein WFJ45_24070, partial [Salmonella enterica subsp. enterica serovar Minnesota]|uniref:hypothetical protein n=1 Tax=Salmonella enterica TaxID=28901 RepID=UPI003D2D26B8